MDYVILGILTFVAGVISVYVALEAKRKKIQNLTKQQEQNARRAEEFYGLANSKQAELNQQQLAFTQQMAAQGAALGQEWGRCRDEQFQFRSMVVSRSELEQENSLLKRDLRNLVLNVRKLQMDFSAQEQNAQAVSTKVADLGKQYLADNVKWISTSLTPDNFVTSRKRLQDVVERLRGVGFAVSAEEEDAYLVDLRRQYELVVRAAFERQEQARIKAQIREEQLREREIERELKQLERERIAIEAALEKALAEAAGQHTEEVDRLRRRLAEAELKAQRTMSQAQMTKSGYVYVISNIGSFGEGVFKIGMTRRLEPMERVRELGDASVPFPFDVHLMVSSDDAPSLENALHRALHKVRLNKINPRKEFFRTDIPSIISVVRDCHGEVEYRADAEALQFRQGLDATESEFEFIEELYEDLEEEIVVTVDDM